MNSETKDVTPEAAVEAGTGHWVECLARVAQDQDRQAFRELFDHFAPLVRSFAYKVPALEQPDVFADELVQETMLKVWTRADTFDSRLASPGTWIFTIARNMRIDLLRKQARHVVNTVSINRDDDNDDLDMEDIWFEDEDSDVFDHLAQHRNSEMIHESLKTLPTEQAFILQKVYLEDKSHSEVAHELSLPLGTVKSRVRLALNKLKLVVEQ